MVAMLDPWIIEEILKKEQERRRESEEVRIELPIEQERPRPMTQVTPPREESERGVMIIDI
ncbi:MAG: hypothetical protein NT062_36145 [Proteobacteria bacterium]|nr:hypothetical protein [Pseudomonadota bacterium]